MMNTVPRILKQRRRKLAQSRRKPATRFGKAGLVFSLLLSLIVALTLLSATFLYSQLTTGLPSLELLPTLLAAPDGLLYQPTRLYDRSGTHLLLTLENPAVSERKVLPLAKNSDQPLRDITLNAQPGELPAWLAAATVAYQDPNFWQQNTARLSLNAPSGLAEKLVEALLFDAQPADKLHTWRVKLVAAQARSQFGPRQIMEWTLNSADYGHLAFGADAAAQAYLGKSADQLTLAEAALLAAVSAAPDLNPWDAPEIARSRMQVVLHDMLAQGWINAEQAQQAIEEPLHFTEPLAPPASDFPAFTQVALAQAGQMVGAQRLSRGGWRIITTLDFDLQNQTQCTAQLWLNTQPSAALSQDCQTARLLPAHTTTITPTQIQATMIDPSNGQILALFAPQGMSSQPSGSLLTPFLALTAFTRSDSPATLVWDIPAIEQNATELPSNLDTVFHGPMRLRTALANDYLSPIAQLLPTLGAETVWHTLNQFGFTQLPSISEISQTTPFWQSTPVTLLQVAQAYSILANQGTQVARNNQPMALLRLEDAHGTLHFDCFSTLANCGVESQAIISPQLAYLLTDILKDQAARWPTLGHPNVLEVGQPVAAKIGRTSTSDIPWVVGYTPDITVTVWADVKADAENNVPSNAASGLWHALMQHVVNQKNAPNWQMPAGLSVIPVCATSGLLPTHECPQTVNELFLNGAEPTHGDTLYHTVLINQQTGNLATVFTPPEQIKSEVYLVVPPMAAAWAAQADIATPPTHFDLIFSPQKKPSAHISSPQMFAYVHGMINIIGSANGSNLDYYRVQIGEGLNPQQWIQIGETGQEPVTEDTLGQWDTSRLQGLYALQLQVVHQDQRIDTDIIQVTVDNQPPTMTISSPADGEIFRYPQQTAAQFQVQAEDDFGIAQVIFQLDGKQLATFTQPPFSMPWKVSMGKHRLQITVTDLAGNQQTGQVTFSVTR